MSVQTALIAGDFRSIRRDPLLAWVALLPPLLALLYRWAPLLRDILLERLAFDLEPYYPLLASSFITAAPGIAGMIAGFMLLDERDEGIFLAIAVSPVAPSVYLAYRLVATVTVGFVMTIVSYPLLGFARIGVADLLAVSAVASLIAPFTALFLAAFAANKISGFAMVKVLNIVGILPVAAWFVAEPVQWLAGVAPSYWPMKMLWRAVEGRSYAWYAIGGVVVPAIFLRGLIARFRRRAG